MIHHRVKQPAVTIGRCALANLHAGSTGRVIGVTSRGVFVQLAPSRVIFLTAERWRGPLTINVARAVACATGDDVRLAPTRLIFPAFEVDLSAAAVWQPRAPAPVRSGLEQRETLKQIASAVIRRRPPDGFGRLLPHLLDLPEKQRLSAGEAALLARLTQLRDSMQQRDFDQAAPVIEGLLGVGRGLTPSGDDVIIGLMLMLTTSLKAAAARLVTEAYQRTTTISANLIECAADGEADERLINVIEGIVAGRPSPDECAAGVLEWGSSSGMDALAGMAIAL